MAQRDGSIFLYLFIGVLFLFGIMTALFFFSSSEITELENKLNLLERQRGELEEDHRSVSDELTNLRVLVGGPTYESSDWPGDNFFRQNRLQEGIQAEINDALKDLGQSPRTYNYLTQPYEDIPSVLRDLRKLLHDANAQRRSADDEVTQQTSTNNETVAELRKEINERVQQISGLEARIEDLDNGSREKEEGYVQQIEEITDQNSYEQISLRRQLNFKNNQIGALQNRLDKVLEESIKEKSLDDVDPDAEILKVLSDSGLCWIKLGRKNHLQKGLVFRVFQTGKGGQRIYKGRMEVRRVGEDLSEGRIIAEEDSLNPIAAGDFVASPFYDPDKSPVFVFAGTELTTRDVTKEYLENKIKSYGGNVQNRVDLNTDYVVITKNYEGSTEYKTARELGVTVIRERDLLEFIGQ